MILLKKKKELFNEIIPLFQAKNSAVVDNYELNELYSRIKAAKAAKVIKPQPI